MTAALARARPITPACGRDRHDACQGLVIAFDDRTTTTGTAEPCACPCHPTNTKETAYGP